MPYSLVSAATLGFDLVRLPAGGEVAGVLLAGLRADADALRRFADEHPGHGRTREQRGVLAVRSRRAREMAAAVPHVRTAAEGLHGGSDRTAVLVAQLERGTLGDTPTLERLLRDDVLGPEHPAMPLVGEEVAALAADVLADAAVGHWAAEVLPPLVRRELTAPFARVAGSPGPDSDELGPAAGELAELFGALRSLGEAGRRRWRDAVEAGRGDSRSWAGAMHGASWAAHVSGRIRLLATAQLRAVEAFLAGGFDGRDGAYGVWNAVAGCVQGVAMGDLLDEASLAVLRAPWRRVTG